MEEAWEYSIKMIQNQIDIGYDNEFYSEFFDKDNRATVKKIFRRMDIIIGQRTAKHIWIPQWDMGNACGDPDVVCYATTVLEDAKDGSDPLKQGDMMLHCCLRPDRKVPQNIPDLDIANIGDIVSDKMATMAAWLVHEYV